MPLFDVATHLVGDLHRNIASIRISQSLSDDLGQEEGDADLFARLELESKPRLPVPAVHRPFESGYGQAILFPFVNKAWFATRFSDGSFSAWYGSVELETTVHETVFHFRKHLVEDPGFEDTAVVGERKLYLVACDALVIDLRKKLREAPELRDPVSYAGCQAIGRQVHEAHHPGLLTRSARCKGDNAVLFAPHYLSNPRDLCFLTYRWRPDRQVVEVERTPGRVWMRI